MADTTLPPIENSDDPPLLELAGGPVSFVGFDNSETFAFNGVPPFLMPVADGRQPDGSVDLTLTLRFAPVPGRTHLVGAALVLFGEGDEIGQRANFESTAAVTRVLPPAGVSFTSTGSY